MGVKLVASSGGSVELVPTNTASNFTATMPAGTGTVAVQGVSTNIVSGTVVASTSGTSIDFTSIPSWVKRITVMFNSISLTGTSPIILQLGDSGGVETSGYVGAVANLTSGANVITNFNTGFMLHDVPGSGQNFSGMAILSLLSSSSNIWTESCNFGTDANGRINVSGGSKSLSATLDRIRLTTVGGSDTFDAGSINILYE
jgi:hypothetical protein